MNVTSTSEGTFSVMTTVPTLVPALVDPAFDAWDQVGIQVGNRVEASTAQLESLVPGLGRRSELYWDLCRTFWDAVAESRPAGAGVVIERQLVTHRQSTATADRRDLVDVIESFDHVAVIREVVDIILSADPDWDAVRAYGLDVTVDQTADQSVVSFTYKGRQDWSELLGGICSRGETARRFTLTTSHAKWRDRRNRRLVAVTIDAVEIWPDPTLV